MQAESFFFFLQEGAEEACGRALAAESFRVGQMSHNENPVLEWSTQNHVKN